MKVPYLRTLTVLTGLALTVFISERSFAETACCWWQRVPCPGSTPGGAAQPGTGEAGTAQPGAATPPGGPAGEEPSSAAAPGDLFAQAGAGAASGPQSAAPFMIGDILGGFAVFTPVEEPAVTVPLPGSAVGRFKMAENTSPMPTDRIYADYDYFHNVPLNNGADINSFSPGFEKTFFGGAIRSSFACRWPRPWTARSFRTARRAWRARSATSAWPSRPSC